MWGLEPSRIMSRTAERDSKPPRQQLLQENKSYFYILVRSAGEVAQAYLGDWGKRAACFRVKFKLA